MIFPDRRESARAFAEAWDAATQTPELVGWQFPYDDLPQPGLKACCAGCPGASQPGCCSHDPKRARARQGRWRLAVTEANGAPRRSLTARFHRFFKGAKTT